MHFVANERWVTNYPGAVAGCMLVTDVTNPERVPALEERLHAVEAGLRARYAGLDRRALRERDPFAAYDRYYRRFGQTYHVQHQVESVALKGKAIPRRAALVEAAFAQELESGILTAMHDADAIGATIAVDVATGDEPVELYNGKLAMLDAGDMYMRDERGILTSVVRGPAAYGLVTADTTNVVVCVYAPDGIGADAVSQHLHAVAENMRLISADAAIEMLEVIQAPRR